MFSICTPIYGVTFQHLKQCAKALSEQDYTNFEWIVVFDGKHKKGEKEMEEIKELYPDMDISWYTIKHKGACAARNYATTKAKGDYYAFPGGDCYLYPQALRLWANEFENPEVNRVWGLYDILKENGEIMQPIGQAPVLPNGDVWYPAFKFSPYADGTFPCRASNFIGWDEDCHSLNDWEFSIRMLKRDNFEGKDWVYIHDTFFGAEAPKPGGLSDHSHQNWVSQSTYLKSKNGIKNNDICVTSLGAPAHGFHVSEKLEADFLPMPSFKEHNYDIVYLLGFYTKEDPKQPYVTISHIDVFKRGEKSRKIVHWIGSDISQLRMNCSFEKIKELKAWFKKEKIIHLCEAEFTQKELAEVGIKAKIVPIPPKKLYEPMELPEEFSVAIYCPGPELYHTKLMTKITECMPDVKFYFFGDEKTKGSKRDNWECLGYIDIEKELPKFSCNLRITSHDGLPLTPLEFLTAGRNVVTNTVMKGAIYADDRKSIVAGIRKAQDEALDHKISKYWNKELDTKKYNKRIRRAR